MPQTSRFLLPPEKTSDKYSYSYAIANEDHSHVTSAAEGRGFRNADLR